MLDFILVAILFTVTQGSYCIYSLMIGSIDGNKYINGMVLALAASTACILIGMALSYYNDVAIYKVCCLISAIFNILFFYTDSP